MTTPISDLARTRSSVVILSCELLRLGQAGPVAGDVAQNIANALLGASDEMGHAVEDLAAASAPVASMVAQYQEV